MIQLSRGSFLNLFERFHTSAFTLFVTPWVGSNPGPRNEKPGTLHSEPLVTGKISGQVLPLLPNNSSDYCAISCNTQASFIIVVDRFATPSLQAYTELTLNALRLLTVSY